MASVSFHVRSTGLDRVLRQAVSSTDGQVREDLRRRAGNVRDEARANLRARSRNETGRIAGSIRFATRRTSETTYLAQVGSDLPEALWVERGTGRFGPHRHMIVPVHRRYMKFQVTRSKLGPRVIFATAVQGQPGKHYLRDAIDAAVR